MSDTQTQLDEINALLAATPNDPSLIALKEDLMQLIALEGEAQAGDVAEGSCDAESTHGECLLYFVVVCCTNRIIIVFDK
jgi:hypothetical protein